MSVFAHIVAELGHAVGCLVGNAVAGEYPGVHPYAVAFALQYQEFGIGADGVEVFLDNVVAAQAFALQGESVAFHAWVLPDGLRHGVEGFLFAGAHDVFAWVHIGESDAGGHVHMAVDDARHDEFATEVGHFALIGRKA